MLVDHVNVEAGEDDGVVPVQGISVQLSILSLLPLNIKEQSLVEGIRCFQVSFSGLLSPNRNRLQHGLINYKDTKPKFRHIQN